MSRVSCAFLVIGVALLALIATSVGADLPKQSPELAKQFIGQSERVMKRGEEEEEDDEYEDIREEDEEDAEESRDEIDCPPLYWSDWSIKTVDPCTQIRHRRIADDCMSEERPCIEACGPPRPEGIGDLKLLETSSGVKQKRDTPWCPEEMWTIYGRNDGPGRQCVAVSNVTYFQCIEKRCQNCNPPKGSSLICIPHKFTLMTIHLNCPHMEGGTDTAEVVRPMDCTCYEVIDTCNKFDGPCD